MSLSFGIGLGLAMQRGGALSGPATLFASGEEGTWYDPSDITTLFQDDAGLTPVTADGQTVGKMLDKSGNGNHATQANSAKRPTYKTSAGLSWLKFDGVDDSMATGNIDFTAGDKMSVFVGTAKDSDAASGNVMELSGTIGISNGAFRLTAPENNGLPNYAWRSRGTSIATLTVVTFTAPITNIITGVGDISGDSALLRIDGVQVGESTTNQGTGNYGTYPLYIGSRAGTSFFFNGKIYGLITRGTVSSADEISDTESYLAEKSGVTL